MILTILAFALVAAKSSQASTPKVDATPSAQDGYWHGWWGNYPGAGEHVASYDKLEKLLEEASFKSQFSMKTKQDGKDPTAQLLAGLTSTLNSLEDTNGIMQAMQIYGEEYYNRLMFWAW
eukprot:81241_1